MSAPTFVIERVGGQVAIRCLLCGLKSYSAGDIEHRYCGVCHVFHHVVESARRLLARGGTHDCGEWRTYHDRCALCLRELRSRHARQ